MNSPETLVSINDEYIELASIHYWPYVAHHDVVRDDIAGHRFNAHDLYESRDDCIGAHFTRSI